MSIFDQIIDLRDVNSYKWDKYADPDVIPVWVADMDFAPAPAITEALNRVTQKGFFGYTHVPDELTEVMIQHLKTKHGWEVKKEWFLWFPGLVPGIALAIRGLTPEGAGVMMTPPVYHPFMLETRSAERVLQKVPLCEKDNRWTFDFDKIKASIIPETKLFLLCNPHNPGGTVFSREELQQLLDICLENNILICSDEIHCDLILDETKHHISIATLSEEAAQNSITLLAPSKTFNIAGLGCSLAVIPNDELRAKFIKAKAGLLTAVSGHAYEAALASYRDGAEWHKELLVYLRQNYKLVDQAVQECKGLKMLPVEATYLAWIDIRQTGMSDAIQRLEKAGVGVSDGIQFDGEGFIRLNFACPRSRLEEVLRRMKTVFV
ncbi:MalY/PatB family protein [Runella sp.]|uniref:MalY/PatB family protein n=1 Tax=Runella sp. TaxID=1960881 RepID=UPI003D0C87A2